MPKKYTDNYKNRPHIKLRGRMRVKYLFHNLRFSDKYYILSIVYLPAVPVKQIVPTIFTNTLIYP